MMSEAAATEISPEGGVGLGAGVTRRVLRVHTGGRFASSVSLPVPRSGSGPGELEKGGGEGSLVDAVRSWAADVRGGRAYGILGADRRGARDNGEAIACGFAVPRDHLGSGFACPAWVPRGASKHTFPKFRDYRRSGSLVFLGLPDPWVGVAVESPVAIMGCGGFVHVHLSLEKSRCYRCLQVSHWELFLW